jgi:signal-transduction protein with cAMP-binding, CBS, and nucleotidyltransferase domain
MRYASLPSQQFPDSALMELAHRDAPASVTPDSPARIVMLDLSDATAVTIAPHERLAEAAQRMDQLGVQLLLVVAQMPHVQGILTLADLRGEEPLRLVVQRQLRHGDLRVVDVMRPVSQLDAVDLRALDSASVGQVVATLLKFGHPHLLVVEHPAEPARRVLRGVVSLAQVERQLGIRLNAIETASSFVEIERALL